MTLIISERAGHRPLERNTLTNRGARDTAKEKTLERPVKSRARRALLVFVLALTGLTTPALADASTQAVPDPGIYNLRNDFRNLQCLAGRTNDVVSISACVDSFTDQYWSLEPLQVPGNYRLRNRIDSRCLGMPDTHDSAEARMANCADNFDDQWWQLLPTSLSDAFMLRNARSHRCLVARSTNGRATQSNCNGGFHDQWWHFFRRG
jgi:hypothetical protein